MACVLAENFRFGQGTVIGGEEFHAAAEKSICPPMTLPDVTI
jgi:hypothetical protein